MGEHVGQADEGRLVLDLGVVVALDRRGERRGQAPAAHEHATHQRVVDTKLAALAVDPFLGCARAAVNLGGIARVRVHEYELADVVQQARHRQPVAVLVADFPGDAIGRVLGSQRVQSEALGGALPHARALEEVEGAQPSGH